MNYFAPFLFNSKNLNGNRTDKQAKFENNLTYNIYLERLVNIAINMFKWENLPDTVSERFIETILCYKGYMVYFNDDEIGNVCLACMAQAPLDIYNIPIYRTAYAPNGYKKKLDKNNSVLIYNNYLHTPTIVTLMEFASRIANIERTIDVNVKASKTPLVLQADDNILFTLKNIYEKYDGNSPVIFSDKNIINVNEALKVFNTNVEFKADRLNALKFDYWHEALTFLGVNTTSDKKERLVRAEVTSAQNSVDAERFIMLNARKEACEKINKMFGTNIDVKFRLEEKEMEKALIGIEQNMNPNDIGGEGNGAV